MHFLLKRFFQKLRNMLFSYKKRDIFRGLTTKKY